LMIKDICEAVRVRMLGALTVTGMVSDLVKPLPVTL
jgi:hypothetical protein